MCIEFQTSHNVADLNIAATPHFRNLSQKENMWSQQGGLSWNIIFFRALLKKFKIAEILTSLRQYPASCFLEK